MSRKKRDRSNKNAGASKGAPATLVFRSFGELAGELASATPSPGGDVPPPLVPSAASEDGHHTRADAVMVRKAMKNEWPVDEELRGKVIESASLIMQTSPKDRNVLAAAKVILQADKLNVDRERIGTPQQVDLNHKGGIDHTHQLRQQMLQDPSYLAYLEQQAVDEDSKGEESNAPADVTSKPNTPDRSD